RQEILDEKSGLYGWNPDVVILAVEGEDWSRETYYGFMSTGESTRDAVVADTQAAIRHLIGTLRQHSNAIVLIHNLANPVRPSLGILDGHRGVGQRSMVSRINDGLYTLTRDVAGLHVVDYAGLVAKVGASQWYDRRMAHYAKAPLSRPSLR